MQTGKAGGRGNAHEQREDLHLVLVRAKPHHKQNRAVHRAGLHSGDGSHCDADGHSALLFQHGLSWAEEVPRLLVTVFAFIACAIGVRDHIGVSSR